MKARLFRDYSDTKKSVKQTYKKMQRKQTLSFVAAMKEKYTQKEGCEPKKGKHIWMRFKKAFKKLSTVIDDSDPDTDLPQIIHAYQTGEALRQYLDPLHPGELRRDISVRSLFTEKEWLDLPIACQQTFNCNLHELYPNIIDWAWLPLIGFLHDLGKVLATKKWDELPQWAVVGDTFPVGAPFSSANVFHDCGFFKKNNSLNMSNDKKKKFGNYKRHCGLENVEMSFGHDEYFYSVLKRTFNRLPEEALYIVRFHSFYPWHTPRDGVRGYTELAGEKDWLMLPLLKAFQRSDLYSKTVEMPDISALENIYQRLLNHFVPGKNENNETMESSRKAPKILW